MNFAPVNTSGRHKTHRACKLVETTAALATEQQYHGTYAVRKNISWSSSGEICVEFWIHSEALNRSKQNIPSF